MKKRCVLSLKEIRFLDEEGNVIENSDYKVSEFSLESGVKVGEISKIEFNVSSPKKGYVCVEMVDLEIMRHPGEYGDISIWHNYNGKDAIKFSVDSEAGKVRKEAVERQQQILYEKQKQDEENALQRELNGIRSKLGPLADRIEVEVKKHPYSDNVYIVKLTEKKAGALVENTQLHFAPQNKAKLV